jgi:hypothetical protein
MKNVAKPAFFTSLVQALAPRTVRSPKASATLGKPLSREFLFYRYCQLLSKPIGQWLVCCAGASPTEVPCTAEHLIADGNFDVHFDLNPERKFVSTPKHLQFEKIGFESVSNGG